MRPPGTGRAILARLTSAGREFWAVAGRGSGKSRIAALLACCFAVRHDRRAPRGVHLRRRLRPRPEQAGITLRVHCRAPQAALPAARSADRQRDTRVGFELGEWRHHRGASPPALGSPRGRAYAVVMAGRAGVLARERLLDHPASEAVAARDQASPARGSCSWCFESLARDAKAVPLWEPIRATQPGSRSCVRCKRRRCTLNPADPDRLALDSLRARSTLPLG